MEQATDLLILIAMIASVGGLFYLLSRFGLHAAIKRLEDREAPDLSLFFDEETASKTPLLIYFHSNTCPACNQVTPLIDRLEAEYDNVVKINCSEARETARAFSIFGTPTVLQIVDGRIGKIIVGRAREKTLRELVSSAPED